MVINKSLGQNINLIYKKTNKFNTTRISIIFYMPLIKKNIAANALVPFLLTSCGKNYPNYLNLNLKLLDLYNADISAYCDFKGDSQLLEISVSFLNDDAVGDLNEQKATELLFDLLFNPNVYKEAFLPFDTDREKHLTAEKIKALFNEKRRYALTKATLDMFKDEPYGSLKSGSLDEVLELSGEDLYNAYKNILKTANIDIVVLGNKEPALVKNLAKQYFNNVKREPAAINNTFISNQCHEHTITEYAEIAQAKMVLGFKGNKTYNMLNGAALTLFTDILGGGPYSKLFTVVREKMSLCYYCAARATRAKGFFTIDCGVDEKNIEKSKKEILNQFNLIKNGEISEEELKSSKTAMIESLSSIEDSQASILNFIIINGPGTIPTIDEVINKIKSITVKDIVDVANTFNLSTVYLLLPKKEDQ